MKVNIELKIDLPTFKLTLTSEVESGGLSDAVETMLEQVEKIDKRVKKIAGTSAIRSAEISTTTTPAPRETSSSDDPLGRVARRLEVEDEKLKNADLFGIKNESPQIFKANRFSSGDALLVLAFLFEAGLGSTATPFEKLKEAFQASHIKAKSPFVAILSNKLRDGHIDKSRYNAQNEVVLTSKGEKQVSKIILDALNGK